MAKGPRSFFERLSKSKNIEDEEIDEVDIHGDYETEEESEQTNSSQEGELAIDMYETHNDIFIKTVVSGVRPEELDISITREKVTIKGSRNPERGFEDSKYHVQELYWGTFSRSVDLPEEIEVDASEAIAKYGLLILKLPKINKNRETKLKVKTG